MKLFRAIIYFMNIFENLNPVQKEAVETLNGPMLILAGAGSGKTKTLTHRIANLIANGTPSEQILAVIFTNKAAKEMRTRVEDILGEDLGGSLWIGTFHSICGRILRREAEYLPVNNNFVIMDADDQLTLVKRILKELNIDDKIYRPLGSQRNFEREEQPAVPERHAPRRLQS